MTANDGWYPDPQNPSSLRYFSGGAWTQHTDAQPTPAVPHFSPGPYSAPDSAARGYEPGPAPARRRRIGLGRPAAMVVGLLVTLVLVTVIASFLTVQTGVNIARTSSWPQVDAYIDDVTTERHVSGRRTRVTVTVVLTYTVDDHEYQWTGNPHKNWRDVHRGDTLTVRYNPDDPADIYIIPGGWPSMGYLAAGAGVLLVIVSVVIVRVRRRSRLPGPPC